MSALLGAGLPLPEQQNLEYPSKESKRIVGWIIKCSYTYFYSTYKLCFLTQATAVPSNIQGMQSILVL